TSWNSLRILHGGLRYLQTLDVARFRESVRERRWFCWHFPELVRPLPCLMPLYGRGLKRPTTMRTALWMNDHLSRHRNCGVDPGLHLPDGVMLSADETATWFSQVDRQGLQGGALWYDAVMVNSQRVLMEMLRWACACGGRALNYVEACELMMEAGRVRGVVGADVVSGRRVEVEAEVVVNCGGPWVGEVAGRFGIEHETTGLFRPSLAFNVLVDRPAMSRAALAVQGPEAGSPVWFVQPWRGRMLAGTVHAAWSGAVGGVGPDEAQVEGFVSALNAALPGLELARSEVVRVYAGLLPALQEGGAALMSRPVIRVHGEDGEADGLVGLVSVSGVKFTTARDVAERTLRLVWAMRGGLPEYQPGSGRPVMHPCLDLTSPESLFRGEASFTRAEVARIVREEAVVKLEDLLLRRTDWACDESQADAVAGRVASLLDEAGGALAHRHSHPAR
ncbi:MAG: FAD-dependent oxidoreductase, partial [Phycisphaeraceae bacterium]